MIPQVRRKKNSLTKSLFLIPIVISVIGAFFVFEASSVKSFREFGDSFYYFKLQFLWIVLGTIVMIFFSFFDYKKLHFFAFFFMNIAIFFLFAVLIPGIGQKIGGARRWINVGFFNFQPSELAKFATLIYLASWFTNREKKRFFAFSILLGILMLLIFLQPDMGTAIIIFLLGISIYFFAGTELHYLLIFLPASIIGFLFLVKTSAYRFKRILAFFNPELDPLGITYHINQIMISLSNGGLFGKGFGASRQKFLFLPEAHTDSIFAIISEEIGFIGSTLLIMSLFFLIFCIYKSIEKAPDRFGKLLAAGIFSYFSLQMLINLGGMVNLLPLTGVPLPFLSYGGSNLIISFILVGIVINIARR